MEWHGNPGDGSLLADGGQDSELGGHDESDENGGFGAGLISAMRRIGAKAKVFANVNAPGEPAAKTGIDLNDESNIVDDLEDATLAGHMQSARDACAASESAARQRLAEQKALEEEEAKAARWFSEASQALRALQSSLWLACEDVLLHSTNAGRLSRGEKPHGYPAEGPQAQAHLAGRLKSAGEELARLVESASGLERTFTLARRGHENVVAGYRHRAGAPAG